MQQVFSRGNRRSLALPVLFICLVCCPRAAFADSAYTAKGKVINVTGPVSIASDDSYALEARNAGTIYSSYDIYVSGKDSKGAYVNSSKIFVDANIDVMGANVDGVYLTVNSALTMNGNISADGSAAEGVHVRVGSVLDMSGDINVSGDKSNGLYVLSSSADVSGDIEVRGNSSIAVNTEGSAVSITGDIEAYGDSSRAVFARGNGTVSVDGNITVSGDGINSEFSTTYGLMAYSNSNISASGDIDVSGAYSRAIYSSTGSWVTLDGNIDVSGTSARAILAQGNSSADVTGNISATGESAVAVQSGLSSIVNVNGNISASGVSSTGAFANASSNIYVGGSIDVTGENSFGLNSNQGAIDVAGDVSVSGDGAYGAYIYSESQADIGGSVTVHGNSASGVQSRGGSEMTVAGDVTVSGDGAYGAYVYNNNAILNIGGGINVSGDVIISSDGTSIARRVYGIYNNYANVNVSGDVDVKGSGAYAVLTTNGAATVLDGNLTVSGDNSRGVIVDARSILTMHDAALSATGSGAVAIQLENGGEVSLNNVTVSTEGARLLHSNSGGTINADSGTRLAGDVFNNATDSGYALDINLTNGSSLTGAMLATGANGATNLKLSSVDDRWNVTGNSDLGLGTLENLGTVDYTQSLGFSTVTVNGLGYSGNSGGSFIMKADMAARAADMLIVSGAGAAHGSYDITILNAGSERTNGTETVTLADISPLSDAEFTLAHVVEQGGWQYTLETVNSSQSVTESVGNAAYGTLWQLRGTNDASNSGSGAINSFAGSYLMAYADTQTLIQRMGDLRESPYGQGLWFRVHGGKFESNSKSYVRGFDMDYGGVQIGYDRKIENKWDGELYVGAMFGYSKGDLDYHHEGSGEVDSKTLGIYGTYIARNGWYVDTILKYQWMTNDFDVIDTAGTLVRGQEVDTGGIGASVEIGKRVHFGDGKENRQGWYVEPQVQLSYQRQDGGYFNATNGLRIGVEPFTSILGRLGMLVGYETGKTNFYAKVSKVKEFDGDLTIRANGVPISESFEDDWWVYGIGCTSRINDRNSLYLDIERTSGGSFSQPWRIFAGWRVEF